jgi:carotenoid cleavage dioxygenase-like enzyme
MFVSNLAHNSLHPNYFTAQQPGERNLWQLEFADRGNCAQLSNMKIAAKKLLHLLSLKHCGKPTVITSLRDVSQLLK